MTDHEVTAAIRRRSALETMQHVAPEAATEEFLAFCDITGTRGWKMKC